MRKSVRYYRRSNKAGRWSLVKVENDWRCTFYELNTFPNEPAIHAHRFFDKGGQEDVFFRQQYTEIERKEFEYILKWSTHFLKPEINFVTMRNNILNLIGWQIACAVIIHLSTAFILNEPHLEDWPAQVRRNVILTNLCAFVILFCIHIIMPYLEGDDKPKKPKQ